MKKIIVSKVLILWLVFAFSTQAIELVGDAFGKTREQAKKQAMAALSESLIVEVKSVFESETHSDGYNDASKKIRSVSELPLLGVDVTYINKETEYYCTAFMNSDKSLKLYQTEMMQLDKSIAALNKKQNRQEKNKQQRYKTLNELLAQIEQYNKYQTVARLLGAKMLEDTVLSEAEIRSEILSIEATAPSLDIAAKILTRDLDNSIYFVQPPLPQGSKQATKLSRLMRDKISALISSTEHRERSTNRLKGSYEILKDAISMTYRVVDDSGAILATRIVKISPSAYRNIAYKPKSINFDQLLHDGYVVSNNFKASLDTNQGNEDLLFHAGQNIELFAKLNGAGYFYVVSHNTTDGISYVLELNEAKGKRAFVKYINADDANRWISLGEFEVSEPYGTESLQLIASNKDLVNNLPIVEYDSETELYIVQASSSKDAVMKTRGLKPKKKRSVKSAEASLSFTTMNK